MKILGLLLVLSLFVPHSFARSDAEPSSAEQKINDLEKNIQIAPFQLSNHLEVIDLYRKRGNDDQALTQVERALKIFPADSLLLKHRVEILFSQDHFEAAFITSKLLVEANPKSTVAHFYFAQIAMKLKKFELALKSIKIATADRQLGVQENLILGQIYLGLGDGTSAEQCLKRVHDIDLKSFEATYLLGDLEWSRKNYAQAESYYEQATTIKPGVAEIMGKYCDSLAQQKKIAALGSALSKYVTQFPNQDWALIRYIKVLNVAGLGDTAQVVFNSAPESVQRDPELVRIFLRSNNPLARKIASQQMTEVIVRSGDTFQKISLRVYGSKKRWKEILELNREQLNKQGQLVVGSVLRVKLAEKP